MWGPPQDMINATEPTIKICISIFLDLFIIYFLLSMFQSQDKATQ